MDYYSLFYDYPDPIGLLLIFILGMMRFVPIVILAPFFGANILPGPVKIILVMVLSIIFLPLLIQLTPDPPVFNTSYIALMIKELLIGLFIGYVVAVPFYMATTSGTLIDHQRGASSMTQTDITMQVQASPIGKLYNFVLIYMFFVIGGPWFFLESINLSYEMVAPTQWLGHEFLTNLHGGFWQGMMQVAAQLFAIAAQMAAPPIVAMLMSDLFLGIANRMAQQIPMAFLGWALKSLVGMAILWIAWYFILEQLRGQTLVWLEVLNNFILSLTGSS